MNETMTSGTAVGFNEFFDWLISQGFMTSAAVEPLRSATRQILTTVEPDAEGIDVSQLNADEYMGRFEKLAGHRYSPDSLRAYRSRFVRGLDLYRSFLQDGGENFTPPVRSRRRAGRDERRAERRPETAKTTGSSDSAPASSSGGLIDYPFPLRSGVLAHFYLPARLEQEDAERMASFLGALVFEPERQQPARRLELSIGQDHPLEEER